MPHSITQIIKRKDARAQGLRYYFTGKPCVNNHTSERFTCSATCVDCKKQNDNSFRYKEKEKARNKKKWAQDSIHLKNINKEWRLKNRAHVIAGKKKWAQDNKQRKRELNDRWRKNNPERVREIARLSVIKNSVSRKKWRKENAQLIRALNWKRKCLLKNIPGHFSALEIENLFKAQNGLCGICKASITLVPRQKNTAHKDHIIPLFEIDRTSNWISNIQLLCPPCNLKKGKKPLSIFLKQRVA